MNYSLVISPPIIITIIILIAAAIGFSVYYFSTKQVIIRTLSSLPEKPVSSLKTNEFTKVYGKALHVTKPLVAPFSKRECIFTLLK